MEIAFAYVTPTSNDPNSPGPYVQATALNSPQAVDDRNIASSTTGVIARICSRLASSGTTPPYRWCVSICDVTTDDSTVRPSSTTAAAVSSHEDSMANIRKLITWKGCTSPNSIMNCPRN
jgi:hypothetical protein